MVGAGCCQRTGLFGSCHHAGGQLVDICQYRFSGMAEDKIDVLLSISNNIILWLASR